MKCFQNKAKIVKVSQILSIILFCGLLIWIFEFFACFVPWFVSFPKMDHLYPLQAYVWGGVLLQPILGFVANLNLLRFFGRLKGGNMFDAKTVGYLSATGNWWLVYWIYQTLFLGGRTLFFQIAMNWDLSCLLGALVLMLVSWFFREAQELQNEQELTV